MRDWKPSLESFFYNYRNHQKIRSSPLSTRTYITKTLILILKFQEFHISTIMLNGASKATHELH